LLGLSSSADFGETGIVKLDNLPESLAKLKEVARGLVGKRAQKYPAFSSRTVSGKPLWQWARQGLVGEVERPKKNVEIYNFEIRGIRHQTGFNFFKKVKTKVGEVRGDFRQEEIVRRWEEVLKVGQNGEEEVIICSFRARVSSGTYIRSLAEEFGQKLGTKALLYSLKRTRVGNFTL